MGIRDRIKALLGVSAYEKPRGFGLELDDASVEAIRENLGGNIQPLPTTRLRWYLRDLESAQHAADAGNLQTAAQLHRSMRRDGVLGGLVKARTAGLIRLPKRFYGDEEIANDLRAKNGSRSVFEEMFPPSELALLDWDGINLGVGVAELVPVEGRDFPVMVRLDPEFLTFLWAENRWYYQSVAGRLPITPGDGRWILHTPGGRLQPWNGGVWPATSESFINKQHAKLHRSNYSGKLANPARLAFAPAGASEGQRIGFFQKLLAWSTNTVLELPVGYDAKILESNGRGYEVFQAEIDTCNNEFMVVISGQEVTTTGGAGFSNAEVPERVSQDLIQGDGETLAYTINTQGLPAFIAERYGIEAITSRSTIVEWNTAKPKDLVREGAAMMGAANGIKLLDEALAPHDLQVAAVTIAERFSVPTEPRAVRAAPEADEGILDDKRPAPALRAA